MKRIALLMVSILLLASSVHAFKQIGVAFNSLSAPGILTHSWVGDHKRFGIQLSANYTNDGTWSCEPGVAFRRYRHTAIIEPYFGFSLSSPMYKNYVGKEAKLNLTHGYAHDFTWNGANCSWEVEANILTLTGYVDTDQTGIAFSTNPSISIGINYFY